MARPWLAEFLAQRQGLCAAAATATLERLPFCLGTDLTRGQAEDLLCVLRRENIKAQVRHQDGKAPEGLTGPPS
jgi:hypothetical protein